MNLNVTLEFACYTQYGEYMYLFIYGKLQGLLLPHFAVELYFTPESVKNNKFYITTKHNTRTTFSNYFYPPLHSPQAHATITKPCAFTPHLMYHRTNPQNTTLTKAKNVTNRIIQQDSSLLDGILISILTCIPRQAISTKSKTTKVDTIPKQIE